VIRNDSLIRLEYVADFSIENDKYIYRLEQSVKILKIFNQAEWRNSQGIT